MATSYRKTSPLSPKDILVFDQAPAQKPHRVEIEKAPQLAAPTRLHDIHEIVEQLGKLGKLTPKNIQPGDTFTLSPRQAWLENRGYLDVYNSVIVASDLPNIQFINSVGPSDEARNVQIWLRGLTPGHSYIAQIRVQAGTGGTFNISTGEGGRQTAAGGDQTIAVLLFQVRGELSLIRVENHGAWYWAFVDATITALGEV